MVLKMKPNPKTNLPKVYTPFDLGGGGGKQNGESSPWSAE